MVDARYSGFVAWLLETKDLHSSFITGHLWYQRPNCHISWPPNPRGHGQRCTWTTGENSSSSKAMCGSLQTDQQSIDATNKNVIHTDIQFYFLRHTIRKVKFLSKNSILTKPQHFHEFFNPNFFDNFSREIKVVNS